MVKLTPLQFTYFTATGKPSKQQLESKLFCILSLSTESLPHVVIFSRKPLTISTCSGTVL